MVGGRRREEEGGQQREQRSGGRETGSHSNPGVTSHLIIMYTIDNTEHTTTNISIFSSHF